MFSDKIKELRKLKSLSQYQLARDLKVSQPTINSWEKGNRTPTFATLQAIADYFGVSIDYLSNKFMMLIFRITLAFLFFCILL